MYYRADGKMSHDGVNWYSARVSVPDEGTYLVGPTALSKMVSSPGKSKAVTSKIKWTTSSTWKPEPHMCECGAPSLDWDGTTILFLTGGGNMTSVVSCSECRQRWCINTECVVVCPTPPGY